MSVVIRKLFKFEGAHIVRNCSSYRCSHAIHGHSYKVEVFLTSNKLDNGQMVYDFGLLKGTVKDFIDSFDHALMVWDKDKELVELAKQHSERHIILPFSPSAEAQAIAFAYIIDKILLHTKLVNNEGNVKVLKVRVHETDTGWAEAEPTDIKLLPDFDIEKIEFSEAIKKEWKDYKFWDKLLYAIKNGQIAFENQKPEKQI